MTKSRKKSGGNKLILGCNQPGVKCPQITGPAGSLTQMTNAGIKQRTGSNQNQTKAIAALKGGGDSVICPQPAAGSGGTISAGGSSAGKNMCMGTQRSGQQNASSKYDDQAKDLNINPPCNPFSGSCPSSGGGKRKRRRTKRKTRRKTSRRKKRKTRRRRKKTNRRKRKSRRRK
jgi:hypothetical protein